MEREPIAAAPRDEWILAVDDSDSARRGRPSAPWVIAFWTADLGKWCDEEGYPIKPTEFVRLIPQPAPVEAPTPPFQARRPQTFSTSGVPLTRRRR